MNLFRLILHCMIPSAHCMTGVDPAGVIVTQCICTYRVVKSLPCQCSFQYLLSSQNPMTDSILQPQRARTTSISFSSPLAPPSPSQHPPSVSSVPIHDCHYPPFSLPSPQCIQPTSTTSLISHPKPTRSTSAPLRRLPLHLLANLQINLHELAHAPVQADTLALVEIPFAVFGGNTFFRAGL